MHYYFHCDCCWDCHWFDDRKTNANTSYEVGFYRIITTDSEGGSTSFYGQFHIILKKIGEQWKIVQDWDTDSIGGEPITSTDYARKIAD